MKKEKNILLAGIFSGILNGLFGSGGGIIAVPLFKKSGLSQKEAQATAIFSMLFLSAVSAGIYLSEGCLSFTDAAAFIPSGMAGSVISAVIFKKIKPAMLKKIFGGFVVFSASRMLWGMIFEWMR